MANSALNLAPRVIVDKRDGVPHACTLHVVSKGQPLPASFVNLATVDRGPGVKAAREIVRLVGGCKGMDPQVIKSMPSFFIDAFRRVETTGRFFKSTRTVGEFSGTAFSGGTAKLNGKGVVQDDMVTNLTAVLAHAYPCIAMSTTPRTSEMALDGQTGGLIVSAYGDRIDFRQHAAVVYQQDPAEVLDWDGDVELYLTMMEGYKMVGFATAIVALNGGAITRNEIYGALRRQIPVIAIEGTLRETDAFCKAARGDWSATDPKVVDDCKSVLENVDPALVSIVPMGDVGALRTALIAHGFLK